MSRPVIHYVEQGSDEWFELRRGIPTASVFKQIMTPAKWKLSASRRPLMQHLLSERCVDDASTFSGTRWTEIGNEREPDARQQYMDETGLEVQEVGFVLRLDPKCGASPDAVVMQDEQIIRGLEIKCPAIATHIKWLDEGKLPNEYALQVQGSMYVTGAAQWDFYSYFPGVKPFRLEVKRDDDCIDAFEECLKQFWVEYNKLTQRLSPGLLVEQEVAS